MGRASLADFERPSGGNGNGSYFKISKNKEVKQVRILLDKPEDIEQYMFYVHDVEVDGKHRWVSCLRDYDEPESKCPFCEAKKKRVPRLFIPLYNIEDDEVQIFDRGKTYVSTLTSFINRYSKPSIVSHIVEIERNGEPNDMKTTYPLYEIDKDDATLEEFPEVPEILGNRFVLDKSYDDMSYYLEAEEFPPADDSEDEPQIRRRTSRKDDGYKNIVDEVEEDVPFEEDEAPRSRRSARTEESSSRRTPAKSRRSF